MSDPRARPVSRACAVAGALALALSALTGIPAVATPLAPPLATAQPEAIGDDIPVLGQAVTLGMASEGEPMILSVHGVRRVDDGTIVYYSAALPPSVTSVDDTRVFGWPKHRFAGSLAQPHCDVGLLSQSDSTVYAPLDRGNICSPLPRPWTNPGTALVVAVALAPVPADVDVVDVSIRGTMITDVPVEDGALTPAAEDTMSAPVLGMGWPVLDPTAIAAADPDESMYALFQAVRDVAHEMIETEDALDIAGDVLFDTDAYEIDAAGREVLGRTAENLRDRDVSGTVRVIGHTDNEGSDAMNQTLSQNRARSVAEELRGLFPDITFEPEGRGPTEPVASNDTDDGKALNRRVTLELPNGDGR